VATRKLATYRSKRDFSRTAEPSGAHAVAPSSRLRFVIQKHAARRLHYDLRLELDGVFKSWAVTRGPSLDPADKRLAVEVEDHPLDYGDFEGTIPQGEYGGGTVQLWDRGYWKPEGSRSAADQLAAGQLKFSLDGDRLGGSWVLVRIRNDRTGGKRTNWLLIKHRDESARPGAGEAVLAEDRSVASGRDMSEIAAGHGRAPRPFMLASRARGQANAVWHSNRGNGSATKAKSISRGASAADARAAHSAPRPQPRASSARRAPPEFVAPQLAKLVERPPTGPGWGHELKIDGYRMQLRVAGGRATLRTRKGLDWTEKFSRIAEAADGFPDCIIDGEVAAFGSDGMLTFHALQAALSEDNQDSLVYYVFDLLYEDGEDLRKLPLTERKARLKALLDAARASGPIQYSEHFEQSGDAVLKSACRVAMEGIVSKRLDAPYHAGRGNSWTKAKCRGGQEVVIGGWTHDGGRVRSLLVGVHRNGELRYAGRVGTGFGAAVEKTLRSRLRAVEADESPFEGTDAPRREANVRWARPRLVAEIEFAGWTGSGMVRQAAFKGLRDDKPAAEVRFEAAAPPPGVSNARKTNGKNAATKARSSARRGRVTPARPAPTAIQADRVMGVTISKPEKALWPDGGDGRPVTKLDLAKYYEAVGPWMLPHLKGRPCSIVRAPDGIDGEQFFQRHAMRGTSNLFTLVKVKGDKAPYLQIDRLEALAAVAQIAALELHPWNCVPGDPELPGRFVFDIDPAPDVDFAQVIEAALELRERLEGLGLITFCKTTGGKGLHVVTEVTQPKTSKVDWPTAKSFAQTVCAQMASDSPERYLTTMAKKDRTGRIFLDYLRNDRTATAVAPLSSRARARATVSMPLTWRQVKRGLDPQRYTVRTAPGLLSRSAAWEGYEKSARPLRDAILKLTRHTSA